MPIAKTSQQPVEQQQVTTTPVSDGIMYEYSGVPIDLFRYFGTPMDMVPAPEMDKLKEIHAWAKSNLDEPTMGNILQKISRLESQLGAPSINEQRWDKMYNWVKITKIIADLDRQREAYRKRQW